MNKPFKMNSLEEAAYSLDTALNLYPDKIIAKV